MQYVLVLCETTDKKFILVEKQRPAWQAGKLNLPGGKIEANESPQQAALRELWEETGIHDITGLTLLGEILHDPATIYCFHCSLLLATNQPGAELHPATRETEQVNWYSWEMVRNDKRLIPNLRIIIPLLMSRLNCWTIVDDHASTVDEHQFLLKIPRQHSV